MKLVYIAGPYRARTLHGIVKNIRAAEEVAIKYWKKGWAVITPHLNSAFLDGAIGGVSDEKMLDDCPLMLGDLEILKRCDAIVLMANWEQSVGAQKEYAFALEHGIEIIHD